MKRVIHDKLLEWRGKKGRKPLLLKGARQVGKTYILKEFGEAQFPAVHYLNFEKQKSLGDIFKSDLSPNAILQALQFHLNHPINVTTDLVIFDEIQECPEALTSLKYFEEEKKEMTLCAAGSLLGVRLGKGSFPVGKVDTLSMTPMTFVEFLQGTDEKPLFELIHNLKVKEKIPETAHHRLWQLLKVYFVTGGLPEVVEFYRQSKDDLFSALQKVREKQESLILAYGADIAKHSGKLNSMYIERLWRNIPAQLAKEQNGSASKFRFKDIIPGINRYDRLSGPIDWLEAAGLILRVPIINRGEIPFSAYTKENCFKLYFFDVGLLGAISQLPAKTILDYDYGTYKGYFAENFVAQEFLAAGSQDLYAWSEGSAELEFIREREGEILPIEVKSGWVTQSKSLKVFSEKYKPPYKTILSANPLQIDLKNHLHRYPLYLAGRFPIA